MKQNIMNKQRVSCFIMSVSLLVLLLSFFVPQQVVAEDNCIDDVSGRINECTANDVRIALILNQENTECTVGEDFEVNLLAELEATSNERWDIGMFVALDGGTARTGICYRDYLPPPLQESGYNPGSLETHLDENGVLIIDSYVPGGPFYNHPPDSLKTGIPP